MSFFLESTQMALGLVFALDPELLRIVAVTLAVSVKSTFLGALVGLPAGFGIAYTNIPGKRALLVVLNTMLALPTVVIGLFVYMFLSRRGILGDLELLYTEYAIVIGQVILVAPLICALTVSAVSRIDERYRITAKTLGAGAWQTALVVLREGRFGICAAVITAFGRVISEIGIAMMLGGNIKGFTRTMTTAMALEYDKGSFTLAIALGILLLLISLAVNVIFHVMQGRAVR